MDRQRALGLLEEARRGLVRMQLVEQAHRDADATGGLFDDLSHVDQHPADAGSETYEREKEETILRLAAEQLAEVEHARRRLDDGTYGRCQTCGVAIADDRLVARPAARFCEVHQREWSLDRLSDAPDPRPLDWLPDDDDPDAPTGMSPEEACLHLTAGPVLGPDEVEELEIGEWARRADGGSDADADASRREAELLLVVDEEERLGAGG